MSCLRVCEECEWRIEVENKSYKHECLLSRQGVGLLGSCSSFKRKTGEHYTR